MERVQVQQQSLAEWLQQKPDLQKFALAVVTSSLVAYYIPLICASLFGKMMNNMTMWIDVGINLMLMMIVSLVGNKLQKIIPAFLSVAALLFAYEISLYVRMSDGTDFGDWLWRSLLPVASLLINAFLLVRMKKRLLID